MRLSAMGDVAMIVPVLRAFASQYPDVQLTVVSRPFLRPLFDNIPNLDFFPFDANGRHKGLLGLYRLYRDLAKCNIDAFADLHNVLRSKIVRNLFVLAGTKTAFVDKARQEKKALTREQDKIFKPLAPIAVRHAKVFEQLGFPLDLSEPGFPPPQSLDAQTRALAGPKSQYWIGIAPFAQYDSKIYPQDLMRRVISALAQNQTSTLFLFGSQKEIAALEALKTDSENVTVVAGRLDFRQELALISNLDLMLGMDSGNAHLAAMFGVKVVTLWGATHPYAGFSPFGQPQDNSIVSDRGQFPKLPTSVYGNRKVKGYENAMRTISPEAVVERIGTLLKTI